MSKETTIRALGQSSTSPDNKFIIKRNGQSIQLVETGTKGTEIYNGYLNEEYLQDLRGKEWADTVDQMRRSDGNVSMILKALKLPILSSNWYIKIEEENELSEKQKRLFEKILFEDLDQTFTRLLNEILTCLPYGYSLFEKVHKVKFNDEEFGTYITLRSIAYRSQRTIEKWNLKNGYLDTVTQFASGDLKSNANMSAEFLLHFSPEMEGSNFEGISVLRPAYGPWLRKYRYHQLIASGNEKYGIPTAMADIPSGEEEGENFERLKTALKNWTSNEEAFITKPEGWKVELMNFQFDSEPMRADIKAENEEMANAALLGFLLLGQSGSGSYALGGTLSDFFTQSVRFITDHIIETIERGVLIEMSKANLGVKKLFATLACDGLDDKASKDYAATVVSLITGGAIKSDLTLEEFLREKFRFPKKDAATEYAPAGAGAPVPGAPPAPKFSEAKQLAEKRPKKRADTKKAEALISSTSDQLTELAQAYLLGLGKETVEKTLKAKNKKSESQQARIVDTVNIAFPEAYYNAFLALSMRAAVQAASDMPISKVKKLSEYWETKEISEAADEMAMAIERLKVASKRYYETPNNEATRNEFQQARMALDEASQHYIEGLSKNKNMTPKMRADLEGKTSLLVDTQVQDLRKSILLQYSISLNSTSDEVVLQKDMLDRLGDFVSGPVTTTGPNIHSTQTVNDARSNVAQSQPEKITSYTFIAVDDDKTSDICLALDGRTFSANDPDVARFTPPLHHNCRSIMQVNLEEYRDNPEIDSEPLSLTPAELGAITLSHRCQHHSEKKKPSKKNKK